MDLRDQLASLFKGAGAGVGSAFGTSTNEKSGWEALGYDEQQRAALARLTRLLLENQGISGFEDKEEDALPGYAKDDARRLFLQRLARLGSDQAMYGNTERPIAPWAGISEGLRDLSGRREDIDWALGQ